MILLILSILLIFPPWEGTKLIREMASCHQRPKKSSTGARNFSQGPPSIPFIPPWQGNTQFSKSDRLALSRPPSTIPGPKVLGKSPIVPPMYGTLRPRSSRKRETGAPGTKPQEGREVRNTISGRRNNRLVTIVEGDGEHNRLRCSGDGSRNLFFRMLSSFSPSFHRR